MPVSKVKIITRPSKEYRKLEDDINEYIENRDLFLDVLNVEISHVKFDGERHTMAIIEEGG